MTESEQNPHAASVRKLADAMLRTTLIWGLATVAVAAAVFTVLYGMPGLLGSLAGGAVAFASSLLTLVAMRKTANSSPIMVMPVAMGGFAVKLLALFGAMAALREVDALHPYALALTMLAAVLVAAAAEVVAFRRTKIPTIVPNSTNTP